MNEQETAVEWTLDAMGLVNKAPFFIRSFIRKKVERYAREQGVSLIDVTFVQEAKAKFER